jgi:hypothetical protein
MITALDIIVLTLAYAGLSISGVVLIWTWRTSQKPPALVTRAPSTRRPSACLIRPI